MSTGMISSQQPDESSLTECIDPSDASNTSNRRINLEEEVILQSAAQNATNLTKLNHNHTYVFTIPPVPESKRSCSGAVSYIELCYQVVNKSANVNQLNFLTYETTSVPLLVDFATCSTQPGDSEPSPDTGSTEGGSILCRIVCFFLRCPCGTINPTENETPFLPVCCARASLNTNLSIPSSRSEFHINPNDNISLLGFSASTTYSILDCGGTRNCSSNTPLQYVPLMRFFIGKAMYAIKLV